MAKPIDVNDQDLPDPDLIQPHTATEYIHRAWLYYGQQNFEKSINDFYKALESDPENVDTVFGLALALKSNGNKEKAIEFFEKTLSLIDQIEDHIRARMLRRLTVGQINQIKTGDWNLEKELWQFKK